ncbi:hypothetical protein F4779DRAFT_627455 [Xylariaceae sp. FL0662B]|nr:hypothetical protein F4779DRAFT_627455 [Xylariaceae sp. FL0662B]
MPVRDTVVTYRLRSQDLKGYLSKLFNREVAVHVRTTKWELIEYPANLIRTEAFGHTLESYSRRLNDKRLFDPKHPSLACIDLYENGDAFHPSMKLNTVEKLSSYIDEEDGAPFWRMVFLQSGSSRGALGCSKEQLTLLLTYYQVMPSFLDLILTFRKRARPVSNAIFKHENYLGKNSPTFALPALSRSGIQIQHAFNLIAVERASDSSEMNQWPLRQVALYHSFDVTNGRCLWIILKGNQLMARRIFSAVKTHRSLKATAITSPETSFTASLLVQMLLMEWCAESWAEYIDYLEEEIHTNSVEANVAPVEQMTSPEEFASTFSSKNTGTFDRQSLASSPPSSPQRRTFPRSSSDLFTMIRRISGLKSRDPTAIKNDANEVDVEATAGLETQENEERDTLEDLGKEFSFKRFQRLNLLAHEFGQAMLVIEQNKGVLKAIEEHYQSVICSYGFTTHIGQDACNSDLATFFSKIRSINRDLDIHYNRLQALSRVLENDKIMTSEYFASSAKTSSDRMETMTQKMHDITIRTEQETISMHIITIFTLIFLPGTFVSTLFSSGVFHWDDDGTLGSDWILRSDGLKLFISISFPMMAIIMGAWSLLFFYMRRKRAQREALLPLTASQPNNTKAMARTRKGRRVQKPALQPPIYQNAHSLNPKPFADFCKFVDVQTRKYVGLDISENNRPFVPLHVLRNYWTKKRISKIQEAFRSQHLTFNIDSIRDCYVRTFSMLVYSNTVAHLEDFTRYNLNDDRLPLKKQPGDWFRCPYYDKLFATVSKNQWLFFPLVFTSTQLEDHHLHDDQVLPIEQLEQLPDIHYREATNIQKMTIHDSCNYLVKQDYKGMPIQRTFILKTYYKPKYQYLYENEVRALRMLRNSPSPNVITYYGSFRQNGACSVILEYCDGGNLTDYFASTEPPKNPEQIRETRKVVRFNQLTGVFFSIHEDIKPENILLSKGPSDSPYDFVPKIADFGLFSHIKESRVNSNDAMAIDKNGNSIYSSPESSQHAAYQQSGPRLISPKADIFSLGTVFSDACAWIKGGFDEQKRYGAKRRAYHETVVTFRGSEYVGCFHDSIGRIPPVNEMHASIRKRCQSVGDRVTPRIITIIENHMLQSNPNDRYRAGALMEKFDQILSSPNDRGHEPRERVGSGPSTASQSSSPEASPHGPSLAALGERISNQRRTSVRNTLKTSSSSIDEEIRELVESLKVNVPDRHHVFLIDDSTSMGEHAKGVDAAFLALLHVTKHLEKGKTELAFASDPKCLHRRRRVRKLAQLVSGHAYRREPDLMEDCFRRLFDGEIIPYLPIRKFGINFNIRARFRAPRIARLPTSIYVFTDGRWGNDEDMACGVQRPMLRLTEALKERRLDKNHISFHFVRFGDDENGKRHLNHLDSSGRADGWDNVDVKHVSSAVKTIIIGPISEANDDIDEDEDY